MHDAGGFRPAVAIAIQRGATKHGSQRRRRLAFKAGGGSWVAIREYRSGTGKHGRPESHAGLGREGITMKHIWSQSVCCFSWASVQPRELHLTTPGKH